jgi:PST family polysaccharide transporter
VNYFGRNIDNILIGRVWGAGSLGLYNKAYGLLLLPLQQITGPIMAVVIPSLSRLQDDAERYRKYYLKAISLIAFVTMPGVMFMIIMSDEIIGLALGQGWTGASRIFAVLGISALIQPVLSTVGCLYVSTGRTDRMFRWGIFSSLCIVVSFIVGLPFGAIGVATAYTICIVLLAVPALWYATKTTPIALLSIFNVIWHPALATCIVGFALAIFKYFRPGLSAGAGGILIGFIGTLVAYLGISCALAQGLSPISEVIDIGRQLRR